MAIRTIKRDIWAQVLDEQGNILFDEKGVAILEFKGTEEVDEEYFEDEIQN
jgi:hypothetical protein